MCACRSNQEIAATQKECERRRNELNEDGINVQEAISQLSNIKDTEEQKVMEIFATIRLHILAKEEEMRADLRKLYAKPLCELQEHIKLINVAERFAYDTFRTCKNASSYNDSTIILSEKTGVYKLPKFEPITQVKTVPVEVYFPIVEPILIQIAKLKLEESKPVIFEAEV